MSKRFSRSGKKSGSDDNAGNFVFSFPGTASPNQSMNFGGSAPSSPIGSPAGFGTAQQPPSSPSRPTFGTTPSSPSASSTVFVFGGGSGGTSASLPGSPNIGANIGANNTAPSSPNSSLRRTFTDITQSSSSDAFSGTALRRSNSDMGTPSTTFTFGSSTNTPSTPTSSTFAFGAGQNQPPSSTATQPATGTSAFTFGAGPNQPPSSTTTQPATGTSAFTFGSADAANPPTTTSSSPFSFGSAPVSAAPSSTLGFGSPSTAPSSSSPAPATFSFGSSGSSTTVKPSAPSSSSTGTSAFSFGSPAPAPAGSPSTGASGASSFSFGTQSTAQKTNTSTTVTPSFSLKMPAPSSTTTTSTPAVSPFGTGAAAATTTASTSTTSSAPTFSIPSTGTSETASLSLGKKHDAMPKTDKPPTSSSSIFSFGSTPAKTTSTTAAAATTTSAISGLPSFSTTKPATTSAAAPIATSSATNPFSFSTTLDNLEKTAKQPPHQIGAALITPSLNALRQNQVVTHTNFRIDNILPSTRYTELPEQARKELDELAQYINGESQRCDYIKKRAAPKRQETMKEAKHEYEILSYRLDSLSNSLQMQVNAVEELFDLLKEQIRHFNDGQSVLDACKHPGGRSARWLHGYGNDDDYFMTLATRLTTRMDEYKRCVREIEFTTESWTKNHAQSPQDIARIMASQNQTFLALTNRVAALHETLEMEQDLYTQYRFQAVTL